MSPTGGLIILIVSHPKHPQVAAPNPDSLLSLVAVFRKPCPQGNGGPLRFIVKHLKKAASHTWSFEPLLGPQEPSQIDTVQMHCQCIVTLLLELVGLPACTEKTLTVGAAPVRVRCSHSPTKS